VTDDLIFRRAIVSLSGIVYWVGVYIQARRIRRHIKRSPNLKPRDLKEHLLWLGWFVVIMIWILQPWFTRTSPSHEKTLAVGLWSPLVTPVTFILGLLIVIAGYAGTLWCYRAMGDSWRIGVNKSEKNALVTLGPYRSVRHPIYLFQIVMLAGALLLLPTVLSAAILLLHVVCVYIKATDEEAYLLGLHGPNYENYLKRTGRLLPKL
jgi:protein-S-isoprenylcysteine O-methyltransferase Ste14